MASIAEWAARFWDDLMSRPSGPMSFRFILQPVMAAIFAIRDGIKDSRTGRTPYFWKILNNPAKRSASIKEGMKAVLGVIVLGLVMDIAFQWIVFKAFRPLEAIFVVFLIAFLPYLLIRGPAARIVRRWNKPPLHRQPQEENPK